MNGENDKDSFGYVYLVKFTHDDRDVYKIGVTTEVAGRRYALELDYGPCEMIRALPFYDCICVEKILHRSFQYKQYNEWDNHVELFLLDQRDLEVFDILTNALATYEIRLKMPTRPQKQRHFAELRRKLRADYEKLGSWRLVAERWNLTKGTAYRIAIHGSEPRTILIRDPDTGLTY